MNRWFDELCDRAEVRRIRVHDLRHTCATLLLVQGVPARVVMEVLGHSQIAVTLNIYSFVGQQLQREAADKMDEALGGIAVNDAVIAPPPRPKRARKRR